MWNKQNNLYTVLIADDEPVVRQGLRCILPWEELGFTVCGEAADGQAALSFLLRHHPDVILLDIQMPGLYGTELMAQARAGGYTGDFIILSGYSDFKYAQAAISAGAVCYLTKPLEEEDLQAALDKIRTRLDATQARRETYDAYREKARQAALGDLLMGKEAEEPFTFGAEECQLVLCRSFAPESPYPALARRLGGDVGQKYPFEELSLGETEVFLLEGKRSIDHFAHCCAEGFGPGRNVLPAHTFLACGPVVAEPAGLSPAFQKACRLLRRQFFCESDRHILTMADLPAEEELTPPPTAAEARAYAEQLVAHLQAFQRRALQESLDELRRRLARCQAEPAEVRHFLADVLLQAKQYLTHAYPGAALPFAANAVILQRFESRHCLGEILQYFTEQFELVLQAIGSNSSDSILDDVLFYIEHNYAQPLKLESIAKLFGYNSSYLGRIFNQHTGRSFNTYLDELRVEKARELLRGSDKKVYEVAAQVGYANVDYFHQKFRRIAGCSPAEYRRNPENAKG